MSAPLAGGSPLDTIFAPATGAGRSAITVLRMSGGETAGILRNIAGRLPQPRRASLCRLRDGEGGLLDRAMVLWLPGPGSYTGEDSAELHLHGGRAVSQAVMAALLKAGARPADAGEFTRRAFLAGRMDLLEAEAVDDLARAETQAQRKLALRTLEGQAGNTVRDWSGRVAHCLAHQEALIDFPDDAADAAAGLALGPSLRPVLDSIDQYLRGAATGARLREGVVVAISGAPNVGKSSLFNALVGRDMAMVSSTAGTTRDSIEARLEVGGLGVTLIDTAGLRDAMDELEAEGVRRAVAKAAAADIVLWMTDRTQAPPDLGDERLLWVEGKTDLLPARHGAVGVSATTMAGMGELLDHLGRRVEACTRSDCDPILSQARHVAALGEARCALARALTADLPELRAEELRCGLNALGRLTGRVNTEDLLDVIFSAFCIGK